MGYRIGKGLGIVENPTTKKYDLCLIGEDVFTAVATFRAKKDAEEVFRRIAEIQALDEEEKKLLELYKGTSDTMRQSIWKILEVTQDAKTKDAYSESRF